jgi:8-oxo-dGTP pyrophosphatase MutT (NUDIX family)
LVFFCFQAYKREVPTYGACILNEHMNKVLLVRGWNSKSWGWPKGKVNMGEDEVLCAAREVEEEIGFDVSPYMDAESVLSCKVGEGKMKIFVAAGVPEDTFFETRTRKEISEIKWHAINDLGKDNGPKSYGVMPVMGQLRSWLADRKRSLSRAKTPERKVTPTSPQFAGKMARKAAKEEVDAAGVPRDNVQTFGQSLQSFSVEEMFRVNQEKFGIVSTYSFEQYTTKLPQDAQPEAVVEQPEEVQETGKGKGKGKGMYAERYRPCEIHDIGMKANSNGEEILDGIGSESHSGKSALLNFTLDRNAIMRFMSFA